MAGPKSVFEMVHISWAEIAEENNITTYEFWRKKVCYIFRHIYLCKQLLVQINSCCQVVI